jgi:hypothetical protein
VWLFVGEAYVCVSLIFVVLTGQSLILKKINLICMVEFNEGVRRNGERKDVKVLC